MPDFLLGFETGSDFFDLALLLPLETDSVSFGLFELSESSMRLMDGGEEIEFLVSLVIR